MFEQLSILMLYLGSDQSSQRLKTPMNNYTSKETLFGHFTIKLKWILIKEWYNFPPSITVSQIITTTHLRHKI